VADSLSPNVRKLCSLRFLRGFGLRFRHGFRCWLLGEPRLLLGGKLLLDLKADSIHIHLIRGCGIAENAADHARTREFLNPAQQRVIEEVLTSHDRIHGLQGLAGSGKTATLETIREGAERNGYAVEGFAPTSRAAGQLRDAGIQADTLQGFLARGGVDRSAGDPNARHLYILDESSLASTRQMQSFLEKIGPQDRVLLVGDTRQHQGVDAGKPFEQMQETGMRTSQLDQIVRQKDPELLRAVEHLSRNETAIGIGSAPEAKVFRAARWSSRAWPRVTSGYSPNAISFSLPSNR
jgi:hypothetical protein